MSEISVVYLCLEKNGERDIEGMERYSVTIPAEYYISFVAKERTALQHRVTQQRLRYPHPNRQLEAYTVYSFFFIHRLPSLLLTIIQLRLCFLLFAIPSTVANIFFLFLVILVVS